VSESFSERISTLKQQTDGDKAKRLKFRHAFVRTFFPLLGSTIILSFIFSTSVPTVPNQDSTEQWKAETYARFDQRLSWLGKTSLGGATIYEWYAQSIVNTFKPAKENKPSGDMVDLGSYYLGFKRWLTSLLLRAGFIVIAFWPLWLCSGLAGYFLWRKRFRGKRTDDLLGVCDRGTTPFYSGVWGPLRSNGSFSGTDYSCPNLACPQMASVDSASSHRLGQTLKKFGALNRTNTDLVRVILAYKDYPSFVEGEQSAEEVADLGEGSDKGPPTILKESTVAEKTIEQSASENLEAVFAAHAVLRQYVAEAERRKITSAQLNTSFQTHCELLAPLLNHLKPAARMLACALTPNRAWAIGHLPPEIIASAYLATEAGKSLVYQREGPSFVRISRYPHLQARSVLQSLVPFGQEYNGDIRLIIRQAIICCRRHGDFGRAFLPERMPVESRALRDWLEILYEHESNKNVVASLVELDAHIEEISVNWRYVYSRRVRQTVEAEGTEPKADSRDAKFWKGVAYKSVVLVPLAEVVQMALRSIDDTRIKRVEQLLRFTHRYQASISISARLPGFKRQAIDMQNMSDLVPAGDASRPLLERWAIVKRMLTRYNWLSTRVGDDAVPPEGFVQGMVLAASDLDPSKPELTGLNMLVPIRHRRYEEMFGPRWERLYFYDGPHPGNVKVFVDRAEFEQAFKREQDNLRKHGPVGASSKVASA